MSYRMIILIAISAVVIYFSIAELVWQFRNRHFRRRLIIGVLIAALLVSQINIINLFTKTDGEKVLAAAVDADTDTSTENVEVSAIGKLSDGIKRRVATMGTALDELMQPDTWKIVNVSADMDVASAEEPEADGDLLAEGRSDVTEGEILTETEEEAEEENPAGSENFTEKENSTETEADTEEESSTEKEKDTEEEKPAEPEKGTEEENPAEAENSTEDEASADGESASESETTTDEESVSESETTTDGKSTSEDETTSEEEDELENHKVCSFANHTVHEDSIAVFTAGGVMLMANVDNSVHNRIIWEPWVSTD